jgi:hypothetical protein
VYYSPTPGVGICGDLDYQLDENRPETQQLNGGADFVSVRPIPKAGGYLVTKRDAENWTIERWKTEPRLVGLEFSDASVEQAPPLWKDLTLASALAVLLWGAAAVVFG